MPCFVGASSTCVTTTCVACVCHMRSPHASPQAVVLGESLVRRLPGNSQLAAQLMEATLQVGVVGVSVRGGLHS